MERKKQRKSRSGVRALSRFRRSGSLRLPPNLIGRNTALDTHRHPLSSLLVGLQVWLDIDTRHQQQGTRGNFPCGLLVGPYSLGGRAPSHLCEDPSRGGKPNLDLRALVEESGGFRQRGQRGSFPRSPRVGPYRLGGRERRPLSEGQSRGGDSLRWQGLCSRMEGRGGDAVGIQGDLRDV